MQDVWDWVTPHWCSNGDAWPLVQKGDVRTGIVAAMPWLALAFGATDAGAAAGGAGAYTLRSLYYARLFQRLRPRYWAESDAEVRAMPPLASARQLCTLRVQRALRNLQICRSSILLLLARTLRAQRPPRKALS